MGRVLEQRVQGAAIQRQYRYDAAGRLGQMQDWRQGLHYSYDVLGQLTSANEERFAFDPAHNLLPATPGGGRVENNRLLVYGDQRFEHDVHGRMVRKRHGRHTDLSLQWNAEHQLERSVLQRAGDAAKDAPIVTGYAYDPFGRRLYKAPLDARGQPIKDKAVWFVWDGNRLLQELRTADEHDNQAKTSEARTYVYEPESFVPLAQLCTRAPMVEAANTASAGQAVPLRLSIPKPGRPARRKPPEGPARLRYYHCDQIGTPRELTTENGHIAWRASYAAWGNTVQVEWEPQQPSEAKDYASSTRDTSALQPLRFQGQYFDIETGLHYNRHRYYDPAVGRFISSDPIGLLGGMNLRAFGPNTAEYVDPLGLSADKLRRSMRADGRPLQAGQTPHHIVQKNCNKNRYVQNSREILDRNGVGIDDGPNGARLWGTSVLSRK